MADPRTDVIGLAAAIIAAFAGAVVVQNVRIRRVLVAATCVLAITAVVSICARRSPESGTPISTAGRVPPSTSSETTATTATSRTPLEATIAVGQALTSDVPSLTLTLMKIELRVGGRSRWYLSAHNTTADVHRLRFNYEATYVSDDQGNRYAMVADSNNSDIRDSFNSEVQPGSRSDFWLEFQALTRGGSVFTLNLMNDHFASVRFAPLEVRFTPPVGHSPEGPAPQAGVKTYAVNHLVESDVERFEMTLTSVDELPNGRTRWNFSAFNRTNEDQKIRFDYRATYCVDDQGSRYPVTGDSFNNELRDGFDHVVQRGVKLRFWIEFDKREPGGRAFTVHLVNGFFATVKFRPVEANLSRAT